MGAVNHPLEPPSEPVSIASTPHGGPVPARTPIGREREIEALCSALTPTAGQEVARIAGVWGTSGSGKTTLALDVARRLSNLYPDGPLYLDLQGSSPSPLSPHEALARLRHALEPEAAVCEDLTTLRDHCQRLLRDRRSILILDDAAGIEQVQPLLPPPDCAALIIAGKAVDWTAERAAATDLPLAPLHHQDARALLTRFTSHSDAALEPLVLVCRGMPLALCLVGSALAAFPDLAPEDYARRLRETQARLPPIEAVLHVNLSLESPERKEQWQALCLLRGFDAPAAAAVWDVEPEPAGTILCELLAHGLVDPSPLTTGQQARYEVHQTLRDYARITIDETMRARAHMRMAAHYLEVLRTTATLCAQGDGPLLDGLALLDLEWDNIRAGQTWASRELSSKQQAGQLCSAYADVGGRCLDRRATQKTRIRWLYDALRAARDWVKPEAEIRHLGRLAAAYQCQGKTEQAVAHYRQALSVARQVNNRPAQCEHLGNLGLLYTHHGDHERAFGYFQQALNVAHAMNDRESEGNWLGNLGSAYSALGEVEQALRCHRQALSIARERGDRRSEAIWLGNLGNSHMAMGEPRRAIRAYRQAIEIARQVGDLRGQANLWGNLGNACRMRGQSDAALHAYESALQIARDLADHGSEGIWLLNKCLILDQKGNRAEALSCAKAARDALQQAGSPECASVDALLEQWQ